jgi:hypothetical protein
MNALTVFTLLSIVVAFAMTAVALHLVFRERRRSAARVAILEADIYRTADEDLTVLHDPPSLLDLDKPRGASTRDRRLLVAPIVAFGAAVAVGIFVGAMRHRVTSAEEPRQEAAPAAASQALELLSLNHERGGDHLTVRGVVRNPSRGSEVDHLTAVVLLFNEQGGFLTSARSPVDAAELEPGNEAKFVVTVPAATDVGKYRVSFRTDDRVVPHVDRR